VDSRRGAAGRLALHQAEGLLQALVKTMVKGPLLVDVTRPHAGEELDPKVRLADRASGWRRA
jgi:hypothetical protein